METVETGSHLCPTSDIVQMGKENNCTVAIWILYSSSTDFLLFWFLVTIMAILAMVVIPPWILHYVKFFKICFTLYLDIIKLSFKFHCQWIWNGWLMLSNRSASLKSKTGTALLIFPHTVFYLWHTKIPWEPEKLGTK